MDRVDDAGHLLRELGLEGYRGLPSRSRFEAPPRPPARNQVGCATGGASAGSPPAWLLLGVAALLFRRRPIPTSTYM